MGTTYNPQLSFEVTPHPHSVRDGDPYLEGGITVAGEFHVRQDLQPGDELTVTIADADGTVVAQSSAEVASLAFPPIKSKGVVIGTTRLHKVKLT